MARDRLWCWLQNSVFIIKSIGLYILPMGRSYVSFSSMKMFTSYPDVDISIVSLVVCSQTIFYTSKRCRLSLFQNTEFCMISKHPLDLVLVLGEEHYSVFAVTKRNNVSLMTK